MNNLLKKLYWSGGVFCLTLSIKGLTQEPIKIRFGWFPDHRFLFWVICAYTPDMQFKHYDQPYYPRPGHINDWYWSGKTLIFSPDYDDDDIPF